MAQASAPAPSRRISEAGVGTPLLEEALFGRDLIDGQFAAGHARARIAHSARFQNPLHLAVFPKRAVDRVERDFRAFGQLEIRAGHVHFRHLRALLAQGASDARAGRERYPALRTRASHENGDFLVRRGRWTWEMSGGA